MRRGADVPAPRDPVERLDPVSASLIQGAAGTPDFVPALNALAECLLEQRIPVWRITVRELTLHPEVRARQHQWLRGEGTTSVLRSHAGFSEPTYVGTPVQAVIERREAIWCRLDEEAVAEFPVLAELVSQGGTDYLIYPIVFTDGRASAVSFATDSPPGFTGEHIRYLRAFAPFLSLRLELASERYAMRSLLTSYLGQNAAQRVLAGNFRRGSGQAIRAAIWTCDMRSFTSRSEETPPGELVALLDRYFEAVAEPIEDNGGEILKFIGDAVLAIFPVVSDPSDSCWRALVAARAALKSLAKAEPGLAIGIGLHLGEVIYGNIGARGRLDFTVIGGPVNVACRVESLCKHLGTPLLMTAAFVSAGRIEGAISLGKQTLRGVKEPVEVFR